MEKIDNKNFPNSASYYQLSELCEIYLNTYAFDCSKDN